MNPLRMLMLALCSLGTPFGAIAQQPVIDVHVHASLPTENGPLPQGICAPMLPSLPPPESFGAWPGQLEGALKQPRCDDPIWAPETPEALMDAVIAELERNHAVGILSGPPERVDAWKTRAPDRFVKSLQLNLERDRYTPEDARRYFSEGGFLVLGEVSNQYSGIGPDDPRMQAWWALAEELDIPVGIHMGSGPPGAAAFFPEMRVAHGNPLLLEPVLHRHPKLRISVQHMAEGFTDEMIMMLWHYPQLYVDIGGVMWTKGVEHFYFELRKFIDAGFSNRLMFGADAMIWPGLITRSVEIIEQADFLSEEQKRAILFDNAVRFFAFDDADMRRRALGH